MSASAIESRELTVSDKSRCASISRCGRLVSYPELHLTALP